MTKPFHLTIFYGGLTRYDRVQSPPVPFSGSPGEMFIHRTLDVIRPASYNVLVPGIDNISMPSPAGARYLFLGAEALRLLQPDDTNLNKWRGIVQSFRGGPAIATHHPIDCFDFKHSDLEAADEEDENAKETKDVGPTSRLNFFHWALLDYRKLMTMPWPIYEQPHSPIIAPPAAAVIRWLSELRDCPVILDIETRRQDHSLDCIGFRARGTTLVAPIYSYTNALHYGAIDTARIFREIHRLFLRSGVTIVGHNLGFDLSVLCFHYGLPVPTAVYDTMLAMHRQFPQAEKSLSHALSLYTYAQRNHKADIAVNISAANFQRLLAYNANDVYWTDRVYETQQSLAAKDEALCGAVARANRTLRTCLIMSFTGMRVDVEEHARQIRLQELAVEQYTRVARILTGRPAFNPRSDDQVSSFIYGELKYPVIELTKAGAPSTGVKTLYKLQIKQPTPIFPIIIAAREAGVAAGLLNFRMKEHKE